MSKLDLSKAIAMKGLGLADIAALKGKGFEWVKPKQKGEDIAKV